MARQWALSLPPLLLGLCWGCCARPWQPAGGNASLGRRTTGCDDACAQWPHLALQAVCPKRFRLAGGASKAASLAAWEGGQRTGSAAATCAVTGGVGEIASAAVSYAVFAPPPLTPQKLRFTVYNAELYFSSHVFGSLTLGPTLRAAYQVWDAHWMNEAAQWSPAGWRPTMVAAVGASTTQTAECSPPSTSTGIGECALSLSAEFRSDADVAVSVTVQGPGISEYVGAIVDDQSSPSPQAQSATLHRDVRVNQATLSQTASEGAVYLVLPSHPMWPGEAFDVQVRANTGAKFFKQLDIFLYWDQSEIELDTVFVPSGDFGTNYELLIEAYKQGDVLVQSPSGCSGACRWQGVLDRGLYGVLLSGNFHVLTFEFALPDSTTGATIANAVRAEVNFFNHEEQGNYLTLSPLDGSIPVVGCEGLLGSSLPSAANIAVVHDSTVALYGSFEGGTAPSTLHNTAVLDGEAVAGGARLHRLRSFQSSAVDAAGAGCAGSPSSAVSCSVAGSELRVELLPSHTTGSFFAYVRAEHDAAQADIHFSALFPEIVNVFAEKSELNNIAAEGHCSGQYEETEIVVEARFTAPDAPVAGAAVDVTQLLLHRLTATSGASRVSLVGSRVSGLSPGEAVVGVQGFQGFGATVRVSSSVVAPALNVVTLDASAASASQQYTTAGSSAVLVEESHSCFFDQEGDAGYVFTFAAFASGEVRLLASADLELTSTVPDIAATSPVQLEVAVGASRVCGPAVSSRWLLASSGQCSGGHLAGDSVMDLNFLTPCALEFTLSATDIARPYDLATQYPYMFAASSHVTSVVVSFCYSGSVVGYTTDVIADSRTTVEMTSSDNVAYQGGVFTTTARTGGAVVTVTFGDVSQSQTIVVRSHRKGSLPEPCAAHLVFSHPEIADQSDSARDHPFSLPTSSVIHSLDVQFCKRGTSTPEALHGQTTWPAVSNGALLPSASHWGLSVSVASGSSVVSLQLSAGSAYVVTPASASGRASLTASFSSAFAPGVTVTEHVDVMRFSATVDGEWCVTNDESAGSENRQCKHICSSSLTTDVGTIAYPGAIPAQEPFSYPTEARVTAFDVRFCAPSCGSCSQEDVRDLKADARATYSSSGLERTSLAIAAQGDEASTGTLLASLLHGGNNGIAMASLDVIAFSSARLSLLPETNAGQTGVLCFGDCELRLLSCDRFQWASVFMDVTLVQGASGATTTKDCTAQSSFSSSTASALPISGSTVQTLSAVGGAILVGVYFGQSAELSVSVAEDGCLAHPALGGSHTAILDAQGAVWTAGRNDYGQLADSGTTGRNVLQQVALGAKGVGLGWEHTAVLKLDGSVWTAGLNANGQLGDGGVVNRATLRQIATGAQGVGLGHYHTALVKSDGAVYTAGRNDYGQLADSGTSDRAALQRVASGAQAVSLGHRHTAVLKADGSVWSAGQNGDGQLADGGTEDRSALQQVASGAQSVSLGYQHTAVLKNDGAVWTAGSNSYGQLADGVDPYADGWSDFRSELRKVASGAQAVSLGWYHSAVLKSDGSLWTAGRNNYGQLGFFGYGYGYGSLRQVATGVEGVGLGWYHTSALKMDGAVVAAGWNWNGQLADGSNTDRASLVPVVFADPTTATTMTATGTTRTSTAVTATTRTTTATTTTATSRTSTAVTASTRTTTATTTTVTSRTSTTVTATTRTTTATTTTVTSRTSTTVTATTWTTTATTTTVTSRISTVTATTVTSTVVASRTGTTRTETAMVTTWTSTITATTAPVTVTSPTSTMTATSPTTTVTTLTATTPTATATTATGTVTTQTLTATTRTAATTASARTSISTTASTTAMATSRTPMPTSATITATTWTSVATVPTGTASSATTVTTSLTAATPTVADTSTIAPSVAQAAALEEEAAASTTGGPTMTATGAPATAAITAAMAEPSISTSATTASSATSTTTLLFSVQHQISFTSSGTKEDVQTAATEALRELLQVQSEQLRVVVSEASAANSGRRLADTSWLVEYQVVADRDTASAVMAASEQMVSDVDILAEALERKFLQHGLQLDTTSVASAAPVMAVSAAARPSSSTSAGEASSSQTTTPASAAGGTSTVAAALGIAVHESSSEDGVRADGMQTVVVVVAAAATAACLLVSLACLRARAFRRKGAARQLKEEPECWAHADVKPPAFVV